MSNEELGLNTFVEWNEGNLFIIITEDVNEKKKRIQLEWNSMVIQWAIVCWKTSCYCSENEKHVLKFLWTFNKQSLKTDHLRLTHKKGVQEVAELLDYHYIISIEQLHHGLTFSASNHFWFTSSSALFLSQQFHLDLTQFFEPFQSFSIADNTLRKQKSDNDIATPFKRSRFNSQRSKLHHENKATEALKNAWTTKWKSVNNETELFKKLTFISQRLQSHQEHKVSQALENTQATSLYDSSDGSFENCLFCCLTISLAEWAISEFNLISELLTALCGAIKAHKSLYIQGGILHRDISENNIIITDSKKADGFTRMLIDLDLAKVVGSGRSGARHQTGTMQFMTIGVLCKVAHTYRHDLESFFYVLLWISARHAWHNFGSWFEGRPKQSELTKWYTGSFDNIAFTKEGYMRAGRFEYILTEFPRAFDRIKPLCRAVRGILFPLLEDGELDTGTPSDPKNLYDSIIKAFDNAIADMAAEEDLW